MQTIFVTGVSSGIGKEVASSFIKKGHRVVGCARRKEKLDKLASSLGPRFNGVQADLSKPGDVDKLFDEGLGKDQKVDVLVNNAGVGYETSLVDGDSRQWMEMIDINLKAVALCCEKVLPRMVKEDSGHIFTVSSMSGHRVTPGGGVYAATKYGVRALMEGLRQDLSERKSSVRVTMVSPGFVQTEFYKAYYHAKPEEEEKAFSSMKALQAEDVSQAIHYAFSAPAHVGINDILMRPLAQVS